MTTEHTGDAGTGIGPVPASPSAHRPDAVGPPPAGSSPTAVGADIVPADARAELDRIRRRWSELPLARAEAAAPAVRALVTELGARTAPGHAVPDLGPAALPDQLAVLVWDACAAGRADGVTEALTALRRTLP